MTGVLLDGKKSDETFIQLYLSLAALQNQPTAFIFGKIRLAQLYLRRGNKNACQKMINELAEMGVEDTAEILELQKACGE